VIDKGLIHSNYEKNKYNFEKVYLKLVIIKDDLDEVIFEWEYWSQMNGM